MALSGILGPVAFGALTELDQQQQTSARLTGDITKAVSSQALADINKRQKDLELKEEYKSKRERERAKLLHNMVLMLQML